VIKVTNLGQFDHVPTNQEIFDRLKTLNSNLDISQLTISNHVNNKVTLKVIPDSLVYQQGTIILNYQFVSSKIDLHSVLRNTNLGTFINLPSPQDILRRIGDLNSGVDTSQLSAVVANNQQAVITVKDNSPKYLAAIIYVTFQVSQQKQTLDGVITNTSLGYLKITEMKPAIILDRIREANPGLDLSQVYLSSYAPTNDSRYVVAVVRTNSNATRYYQSQVTVYFNLLI
jgi:hypothetical protein